MTNLLKINQLIEEAHKVAQIVQKASDLERAILDSINMDKSFQVMKDWDSLNKSALVFHSFNQKLDFWY